MVLVPIAAQWWGKQATRSGKRMVTTLHHHDRDGSIRALRAELATILVLGLIWFLSFHATRTGSGTGEHESVTIGAIDPWFVKNIHTGRGGSTRLNLLTYSVLALVAASLA